MTMTREQRLIRACEYIKDSVLVHGGSEYTAYLCAAEFARGVRASWEEDDAKGKEVAEAPAEAAPPVHPC